MRRWILLAGFATTALYAQAAFSQSMPKLDIGVEGIATDGYIDTDYAFCVPAAAGHVKTGPDKSLGVRWSKGPEGTQSYALLVIDTDVPTRFDDAGKEGRTIAADLPRRDFFHWVLYDIPAETSQIPANTDSQVVVQHGKAELKTPYGMRGANDYGPYFAGDPDRKGVYAGYDGPCPPWNDARIHHYHVKVFALDTKSLGLPGPVTGVQVRDAMKPHILAEGEVVGKYTLNPDVKK